MEKLSADPFVGEVHEYSFDVQQLGLSPNAFQTGCHALLGLLMVDFWMLWMIRFELSTLMPLMSLSRRSFFYSPLRSEK